MVTMSTSATVGQDAVADEAKQIRVEEREQSLLEAILRGERAIREERTRPAKEVFAEMQAKYGCGGVLCAPEL